MQKLGSKFFVIIGTLILFFSVFLLYRTWTTSKSHVERLAGQEADLALSFDIAVRDYVREQIQPRMFELAGRENFDPETMSPTYIARSIFEKIQKNFPDVILKFSAANPKNPTNLADPEELRLIDFFNKNPEISNWSGEIAINGKRYSAKFHARQMEESCLLCHGNPDDAPDSIIKLYGPSSGFNWPLGKVVGLDTIAIPIDWIHDHLWSDLSKNFMIISIGVASLFMAIFFVFKFLVTARLNSIKNILLQTANQKNPYDIKPIPVDGNDEISDLASSINKLTSRLRESYDRQEEQSGKLSEVNKQLKQEINQRRKTEQALEKARNDLEMQVVERTEELIRASLSLEKEILERQRAEEIIKNSYAELDQIFNTAADGMRVIAKDFTILRYNRTFLTITRLNDSDVVGKKCHEVFPGPRCHTPQCPLNRILHGETSTEDEVFKERPDGIRVPCIVVARPYIDHDGELIGIIENIKDITDRKRAENALRESEEYLRAVMETIQTGVLVVDKETGRINDANPSASQMFDRSVEELIGSDFSHFIDFAPGNETVTQTDSFRKEDCIVKPQGKRPIHVRRSSASLTNRNHQYTVHSLLDITDMKHLLEQQEININLARKILGMINSLPARYTILPNRLALFTEALSIPCHAEGGDHYFIKAIPGGTEGKNSKTIISLKDQSGHAVNCILRSIITDLIHNTFLFKSNTGGIEKTISQLNSSICVSDLFRPQDFTTAINAEIDHETLLLRYVSAGHPPFLLIRGKNVMPLAGTGRQGTNLPLAIKNGVEYSAGAIQLEAQDKLIFFTDGLLDIPQKKQGKSSTINELQAILSKLLNQHEISVSELINSLLHEVTSQNNEIATPYGINSTNDDITIIGLEIEKNTMYHIVNGHPTNPAGVDSLISQIIHDTEADLHEKGFTTKDLMYIRLAMTEAVLNAWKHGHKQNPEKPISVRYRLGNDFIFEVIDQGKGFNPRDLADPTTSENIINLTGRGIFLMRRIASSLQWLDNGRHLIATFKKQSFSPELENNMKIYKLIKLWGD